MENLLPNTRVIVTVETEIDTCSLEHHWCRPGMRSMTSGATIFQGRMNRGFTFGFAVVAHVAKRGPLLVKEEIVITLMRRMAANTAIFQGWMDGGDTFSLAFMTHITERCIFFGEFEGALASGMLFPGRFMTNRAFLRCNRTVYKLRLADDGMTT